MRILRSALSAARVMVLFASLLAVTVLTASAAVRGDRILYVVEDGGGLGAFDVIEYTGPLGR